MSDMSNSEWLKLYSRGYRIAFALALAAQFLVHEAAEIARETMAKTLAYVNKPGRDIISFGGLVHTVARGVIADEIERRVRARAVEEHLRSSYAPASRESDCLDKLQRLREAIARLPEPYRTTLEIVYIAERPLRQAAEDLEITLGALKKRLYRGRNMLRARLGLDTSEDDDLAEDVDGAEDEDKNSTNDDDRATRGGGDDRETDD